jgi:hypothetical protein
VKPVLPAILATLLTGACSTVPPGNSSDRPTQTFTAYCSACHDLPHPKRHTYTQWQVLIPVMEQRMKERGMAPLDERQRRDILAYLKQHAR